jgi:hypothetical protein
MRGLDGVSRDRLGTVVRSAVIGALSLGMAVSLSLVPVGEASAQTRDDVPPASDMAEMDPAGEVGIDSAVGMALFSAACVRSVCWPGATLVHTISGKKRSITYQEGFFTDLVGAGTAGRRLCNWRVDFVDYNSSGNVNRRSRGGIHSGCTILESGRKATVNRTAAASTVKSCAELYSADVRIVRQCHFIYS